MKTYIAQKLSDLKEIAEKLLSELPEKRVFIFDAPMGTGKTTFIKSLCDVLLVTDEVTSPTFAIVNEYQTGNKDLVYHFDYYRIKDIREAVDFGSEEYFFSGRYCFIEWPQIIEELLPDDYVRIVIRENEKGERQFIVHE